MQIEPYLLFDGDCEAAIRFYEKVLGGEIEAMMTQEGTVTMPFAQTFWAYRFGTCTDRYGTPWMINCEKAA